MSRRRILCTLFARTFQAVSGLKPINSRVVGPYNVPTDLLRALLFFPNFSVLSSGFKSTAYISFVKIERLKGKLKAKRPCFRVLGQL
jgi:hypothetical protein